MARLRLGVALLLPPPVCDEVDGLRRGVGDGGLGRVPPHVTLVPPVNVRREDLGRVLGLLRSAAATTPRRLRLTLGPPTSFLPAAPVLYLPVGGDARAMDTLYALRDRVFVEPLARPLTWPFVPHVTLADGAAPELIEHAEVALGAYRAEAFIDGVHLLQEVQTGGDRRWHPLADVAFGRPSVVARAGPLAIELVRSRLVDPEAVAMLEAEDVDLAAAGDVQAWSGRVVMTARREGQVVGVATAWLSADGRQVDIFVALAHRRQGIGRQLRAAIEASIQESGWA